MKFGVKFEKAKIPEWKTQYVDYDYLKELIDKVVRQMPNLPEENEFTQQIEEELKRVNDFYKRTELRFSTRHGQLYNQCERLVKHFFFYDILIFEYIEKR